MGEKFKASEKTTEFGYSQSGNWLFFIRLFYDILTFLI